MYVDDIGIREQGNAVRARVFAAPSAGIGLCFVLICLQLWYHLGPARWN